MGRSFDKRRVAMAGLEGALSRLKDLEQATQTEQVNKDRNEALDGIEQAVATLRQRTRT